LKDICLALAAAQSMLVPMPLANQIRDCMLTVVARGQPFTGYRPAIPGVHSSVDSGQGLPFRKLLAWLIRPG
jgi:hypothetical protein